MTIARRMSFPGHRGVTLEATMPMLTVRRQANGRGLDGDGNCVAGPSGWNPRSIGVILRHPDAPRSGRTGLSFETRGKASPLRMEVRGFHWQSPGRSPAQTMKLAAGLLAGRQFHS